MNRKRAIPGNRQAAENQPSIQQQTGFDPALEALFERANRIRAHNGLGQTADSTIAAQMVLTSIAMDVLYVADREIHPDVLDTDDAGLAWAYVCFMGMRIIAIADQRDDFDNQAFVLAVASAVFQFYGDEVALRIVQAGTGLFQEIVSANSHAADFVELNDQVHKLVLAYLSSGTREAIDGLRQRYATFAMLADRSGDNS